jgi:hypothetical protein
VNLLSRSPACTAAPRLRSRSWRHVMHAQTGSSLLAQHGGQIKDIAVRPHAEGVLKRVLSCPRCPEEPPCQTCKRLTIRLGVWQVLAPPSEPTHGECGQSARAGLLPEASVCLMGPAGAASERRIGNPVLSRHCPPSVQLQQHTLRATSIACPHSSTPAMLGLRLKWEGLSRCLPMSPPVSQSYGRSGTLKVTLTCLQESAHHPSPSDASESV